MSEKGFMASLRKLLQFLGPGFLVAVGYFDPGNWSTDLKAGSHYGYDLLCIILISNIMAVLFQYLCIRLGVVTGFDLAQACHVHFHKVFNYILYALAEIAIIATDLAEVIGSAIALNLLFGLPLHFGVLITAVDVLIIMFAWNSSKSHYFEYIIGVVVFVTGACLAYVAIKSNPDWKGVGLGFLPDTSVVTETSRLFIAVGILGATVMPHNLYLHSHIVRFRASFHQNEKSDDSGTQLITSPEAEQQPISRHALIPEILKWTTIDAVLALNVALLVNSFILIVAAASFNSSGQTQVEELEDAYNLLRETISPVAGVFFAFALLLAGQSSTITGTLAGQFVMEGFLGLRIRPWLRRMLTRSFAIIPALVVVLAKGSTGLNDLLILSQVILSLQLPFAVWPLIYFTSSSSFMTITFFTSNLDESSSVLPSQSISSHPVYHIDEEVSENTLPGTGSGAADLQKSPSERSEPTSETGATMIDQTADYTALSILPSSPQSGKLTENYANNWIIFICACLAGIIVTVLNIFLIVQAIRDPS